MLTSGLSCTNCVDRNCVSRDEKVPKLALPEVPRRVDVAQEVDLAAVRLRRERLLGIRAASRLARLTLERARERDRPVGDGHGAIALPDHDDILLPQPTAERLRLGHRRRVEDRIQEVARV